MVIVKLELKQHFWQIYILISWNIFYSYKAKSDFSPREICQIKIWQKNKLCQQFLCNLSQYPSHQIEQIWWKVCSEDRSELPKTPTHRIRGCTTTPNLHSTQNCTWQLVLKCFDTVTSIVIQCYTTTPNLYYTKLYVLNNWSPMRRCSVVLMGQVSCALTHQHNSKQIKWSINTLQNGCTGAPFRPDHSASTHTV